MGDAYEKSRKYAWSLEDQWIEKLQKAERRVMVLGIMTVLPEIWFHSWLWGQTRNSQMVDGC